MAIDFAFGTKASSNSNRLATIAVARKFTPVMLGLGVTNAADQDDFDRIGANDAAR